MKNKEDDNIYKVKFIIVGNSFIGKTNIFFLYIKEKFANELDITISVEFKLKLLK